MLLKRLYLHNFRLYEEAVFNFCPSINLICGANAQGKTTVLEVIYYLMTGRSFRALRAEDLIRHGADFFYIEATFEKHGIEQRLRISASSKEKKIFYNNTECPTNSGLLGILQGVLMTPDDAMLVKGAPQIRRQFLDLQLAQADPLYVHHLTRYHRAMRQRNFLLRAKESASIESWEHEMAHAASYIVFQRNRAIQDLQSSIKDYHTGLAGRAESLELFYKSQMGEFSDHVQQESIRKYHCDQYSKHRKREMLLGATLCGPHKDDLMIHIDAKDARYFASEGQQRTSIASLKFAEYQRLRQQTTEAPLMLMDDVGVSLDETRRQRLLEHFKGLGQVFLTSTQVLAGLTSNDNLIQVSSCERRPI